MLPLPNIMLSLPNVNLGLLHYESSMTISHPVEAAEHYGPEATPTKEKSTGRSESSSDTTMTSPVTKKNFKIGPLGDFEKSAFLYFHPSQYNLAPGIKGATDQMLP